MSDYEVYEIDITELQDDPTNANRGTERGQYMMDQSVSQTGLHRGVAVDANGYLVAGNKTRQAAVDAGYKRAVVVETDGDTLVVTKRRDFDLQDPTGVARKAALFDNRTSEVNYDVDPHVIAELEAAGAELSEMYFDSEITELLEQAERETSGLLIPDFQPVDASEQPRLDQKNPVFCPHCNRNIHEQS